MRNLPHGFYLLNDKTIRQIAQFFVAFSEKLSFKYFAFQVKSMVKGMTIGVNEDTLGAILKASIAQFISLEITKSNSTATFGRGDASRESRSVNRYLPWLSSPPANTAAQGLDTI